MYLSYLQAVGIPLCTYTLFLFLCQQVASFCRGYWLSLWADDPVVDGQQMQTALRGWVFGLLGCLQGTWCSQPHPILLAPMRGSPGSLVLPPLVPLDLPEHLWKMSWTQAQTFR